MHTRLKPIAALLIITGLAVAFGGGPEPEPEFTDDFDLENCQILLPNGANPYFSLTPGHFLRFEGFEDDEFIELEITVLGQIRPFFLIEDGNFLIAIARVIEEREWVDGELVEVSRNYFARCPNTNDIFYFGEEVDIYEDDEIISHDGAWLAGVDDARPGLIMPGRYLLGSRYFQEVAPDVALDRAEHVEMGLEFETPAGVFEDCVLIVETTPLDPDEESVKIYAPGIGLIADEDVLLVEYDN